MFVFKLILAMFGLMLGSMLRPDDPPEDPPEDDDSTDDNPDPPADENYRVYKTQEDHERAFGPIRIEGRDAEKNRWLEALEVEDEDEAKRLVGVARDIEREAETEAEKKERERAEEERKRIAAEQRAQETETKRKNSVKRVELRDAIKAKGVRDDRLQRALSSADLDNLEIDDNDVVTGHEEEAERVANESPEWFTEVQEDGVPPTRGRSGGGGGGGGGGKDKKRPSSRFFERRTGAGRR